MLISYRVIFYLEENVKTLQAPIAVETNKETQWLVGICIRRLSDRYRQRMRRLHHPGGDSAQMPLFFFFWLFHFSHRPRLLQSGPWLFCISHIQSMWYFFLFWLKTKNCTKKGGGRRCMRWWDSNQDKVPRQQMPILDEPTVDPSSHPLANITPWGTFFSLQKVASTRGLSSQR